MQANESVTDKGMCRARWLIASFADPDGKVARSSRGQCITIKRLGIRIVLKRGRSHAELMQRFKGRLIKQTIFEYNLLLNEGINELWTLVAGTGATKFDNTNAYIGVGDSATAADATQTGLQAATNKVYKAMDASYPTYGSSQKTTWRSTFGSGDANFAWNEITVANGNSDASKNLNRKVQSMGTKAILTTWVATLEITLS